ncbi:MAG: universal stress protein [Longimicrobiales bacterium]
MLNRILVPVDGSTFAEHALCHAIAAAERENAELHLLLAHHVALGVETGWMHEPGLYTQAIFEREAKYLSSLRDRLESAAVERVHTHHVPGEPAELITRFATEHDIDLIVMSTHGRGGLQRAYLGSVADSVVRRSVVPVMLVRPDADDVEPAIRRAPLHRILVAVDASEGSERVLSTAVHVASIEGAHCTVMQVVVPPVFISSYLPDTEQMTEEQLDSAGQRAQRHLDELQQKVPGVDDTHVIVHLQPAVAILGVAKDLDADMIAVGTRGMGPITRFLIGSVADKVVRGADVPVLIVPEKMH